MFIDLRYKTVRISNI